MVGYTGKGEPGALWHSNGLVSGASSQDDVHQATVANFIKRFHSAYQEFMAIMV